MLQIPISTDFDHKRSTRSTLPRLASCIRHGHGTVKFNWRIREVFCAFDCFDCFKLILQWNIYICGNEIWRFPENLYSGDFRKTYMAMKSWNPFHHIKGDQHKKWQWKMNVFGCFSQDGEFYWQVFFSHRILLIIL
jgi:hypothetical protein